MVSIVSFAPFRAEVGLTEYLSQKAYLPADFMRKIVTNKLIYAPVYRYECSWSVSWTASFGYDRWEHYTHYQHHHGKPPVPENRTRLVTTWSPATGTDSGTRTLNSYAGADLPAPAMVVLRYAKTEQTFEGEPDDRFEPFALTADRLWDLEVSGRLDIHIDSSVRRHAQGDRQQGWTWSGSKQYTARPVMCPLHVIDIEYRGKPYRFWVDGSCPVNVQHGKLPKDHGRYFNGLLAFVPAAFSLAMLVLLWPVGRPYLAAATVLLGLGGWFVRKCYERNAREMLKQTAQLVRTA